MVDTLNVWEKKLPDFDQEAIWAKYKGVNKEPMDQAETAVWDKNPGSWRDASSRPEGACLNELSGRRAGTACNYILPSQLFCQKWCVDLTGRILELRNQFRVRRSAYFSRSRAWLKNHGHCIPRFL